MESQPSKGIWVSPEVIVMQRTDPYSEKLCVCKSRGPREYIAAALGRLSETGGIKWVKRSHRGHYAVQRLGVGKSQASGQMTGGADFWCLGEKDRKSV